MQAIPEWPMVDNESRRGGTGGAEQRRPEEALRKEASEALPGQELVKP
jgi:hypothetical protein